jgi:hypothetical protein
MGIGIGYTHQNSLLVLLNHGGMAATYVACTNNGKFDWFLVHACSKY